MFGLRKDKLALSSGAMKVAAGNLKDPGDPAYVAKSALGAALRHEGGFDFLYSSLPSGNILDRAFDSSVVWLFGTCGSGKSESIHAWARSAVRHGHRVIKITGIPCGTDRWRWLPDERSILDLKECVPEEIKDLLAESLTPRDPQLVLIELPIMLRDPEYHTRCLEAVLRLLPNHLRDGDIVTLHGLQPGDYEALLEKLMHDIRQSTRNRIVVESDRIWKRSVIQQDARIYMRWVGEAPEEWEVDHESLRNFREGEGWLDHDGSTTYFVGPYEFEPDPASVWQGASGAALERLKIILTSSPPKTHTARLEAVARACGYRSWHAAQGRRS